MPCRRIFRVRYTFKAGGASRDRTDDPLLAKQVLSQLSYGPVSASDRPGAPGGVSPKDFCGWLGAGTRSGRTPMSVAATTPDAEMVGLGGLEPPTSPLSGVRSNHLSYRPRPDGVLERAGNL